MQRAYGLIVLYTLAVVCLSFWFGCRYQLHQDINQLKWDHLFDH